MYVMLSEMSCSSETMSSNSPALNLVMPHFSEMWIFWWSEDMNLALCWLNHMFLTLQHGMDGHDDLTTVPRIPEGTTHTCLKPVSPSKGHHVGSDGMERVEPHSNMKGFFQQLFTMYMTQIQVVSRTHLHLTPIRPQSRNSSTSDFSCTLPNHEASGMPQQKWFGIWLVLTISVTH